MTRESCHGSPPAAARLRAAGMLLIGGASRDAGKTTLCCQLVSGMARHHRAVAAVKVTIVRQEGGGGFTRAAARPGVCEQLDAPFRLSEAQYGTARGDAARLLAAGARPVLWLCARPETLAEGARALLGRLPPGGPVVCESNGLREVLEPDLFIIVRRPEQLAVKASARAQWELADAIVESAQGQFVPGASDFAYGPGGWTLRRPATGVVLAGGRSSRMQRDKALLPLEGRPLIARVVEQMRLHVDEVLLSADDASKYAFLDLPVIPDRQPDQGPMMAIASTLGRARHELVLYSPCDVPDLPAPLLARLFRTARSGGDIIVPRHPEGRHEPLLALYRRSILPAVLRALEAGERRIVRVYGSCDTRAVEIGPGEELRNINTAADYAALIRSSTR